MSSGGVEPCDERAYTDFVRRCRPELLRFVRRLSGPECDHESVVQETLERAWRKWSDIRDPRPWAFRVAANMICSNTFNGKAEQPIAHIPSKFRWISTAAVSDLSLVAEALFVRDSIGELPSHQQVAVYLFHIEGWGYKDIAQVLGCSQSTVGVHIYRGTRAVRNACAIPRVPQGRPSDIEAGSRNKPWLRYEEGSASARVVAIGAVASGFSLVCFWLGLGLLAAVLISGALFLCFVLRITQILCPRRSRSIGQRMIAQQEVLREAGGGQGALFQRKNVG